MVKNQLGFKTIMVGGFDKEEVLTHIQTITANAEGIIADQKKQLEQKDTTIKELEGQLEGAKLETQNYIQKNEKLMEYTEILHKKEGQLQNQITQAEFKYKKYLENYENISKLVLDAQIKADEMTTVTHAECQKLLATARNEIDSERTKAQLEMKQILDATDEKYQKMRWEMQNIAIGVMEAQEKLINSYENINKSILEMPQTLGATKETPSTDLASELAAELAKLTENMPHS